VIYFCFISVLDYRRNCSPLLMVPCCNPMGGSRWCVTMTSTIRVDLHNGKGTGQLMLRWDALGQFSLHIVHYTPCLHKCHSDGRLKRMQILFNLIFNQRLSFSQLDTFLMTLPSQRSHFYCNIKPHP